MSQNHDTFSYDTFLSLTGACLSNRCVIRLLKILSFSSISFSIMTSYHGISLRGNYREQNCDSPIIRGGILTLSNLSSTRTNLWPEIPSNDLVSTPYTNALLIKNIGSIMVLETVTVFWQTGKTFYWIKLRWNNVRGQGVIVNLLGFFIRAIIFQC